MVGVASGRHTGDADVGPVTLGGARRAPCHTLAPVVLQPEELFHLLPGHLDLHISHPQAWAGTALSLWVSLSPLVSALIPPPPTPPGWHCQRKPLCPQYPQPFASWQLLCALQDA